MINDIKTRLESFGYTLCEDDSVIIEYLIAKVETDIKNVTNLSEVPEGLRYEWIDAVCGEFLQIAFATGKLENIAQVVKSIKEGDTMVTLDEGSAPESQLKSCLRSLQLDKRALLKYRVIVW